MNYRHIYHIGIFADVFKHAVLVTLLQALQRKDKPFCYLDTHAGIGRYDLESTEAQKTKEYLSGIGRLVSTKSEAPAEIKALLETVYSLPGNEKAAPSIPRFYPGSPRIARSFLRPQDRMVLSELHPEDAALLKQEFRNDKQVAVHQMDGYQALKAFTPPKEHRGLVLIDPPYEKTSEVDDICRALASAIAHWANGIYAIWYPLKDRRIANNLLKQIKALPVQELLCVELSIYPEDSPMALNGSGMLIINPPWQIDNQLKQLLPWLWQVLSPEKFGNYNVTAL